MTRINLSYRVWSSGRDWRWEARSVPQAVLASGCADNSVTARVAAVLVCLRTLNLRAVSEAEAPTKRKRRVAIGARRPMVR
jgi:hypothetical protein